MGSAAGARLPGTPAAARRGNGSTRAVSLCRRRCFAGTRRRAVATLWDARKGLDSWQDREPEGPVRPPPPRHPAPPLPPSRPFSLLLPDSNEGLFSRGTPRVFRPPLSAPSPLLTLTPSCRCLTGAVRGKRDTCFLGWVSAGWSPAAVGGAAALPPGRGAPSAPCSYWPGLCVPLSANAGAGDRAARPRSEPGRGTERLRANRGVSQCRAAEQCPSPRRTPRPGAPGSGRKGRAEDFKEGAEGERCRPVR